MNRFQMISKTAVKMIDHQAEMWAVLCEPPEQFNDPLNYFDTVEFKKKFNSTSFTWNNIDPDVVICKFRIACVEYAVHAARKAQPTNWQPVEDACRQVIDALNGNGDLVAARAAADAARAAAARAAYAAADAARAAAAADAAADAAAAAYYAAYVAARADLFEIFINIILSEYENKC